MATFVVHLSDEVVEDQASRLREAFPGIEHYRVSDRLYFVRSDATSRAVAERIGLRGGEPPAAGAVLKLNGEYSGFDRQTMWDWLSERLQEGE